MQNARLISTVKALKDEMKSTVSKQEKALDTRIPPMTQKYILERLEKESTIERSIQTLTERMEVVEKNLPLVLQNHITQAKLLKNLFSTHSGSSFLPLVDNKKGRYKRRING